MLIYSSRRRSAKLHCTYLFFRLQLVLDLGAEDGQQNAATQWQSEDFRVHEIFDALHLPLRESTRGNFRDNLDNEIAVGIENFVILAVPNGKVTFPTSCPISPQIKTHLNFNGS